MVNLSYRWWTVPWQNVAATEVARASVHEYGGRNHDAPLEQYFAV